MGVQLQWLEMAPGGGLRVVRAGADSVENGNFPENFRTFIIEKGLTPRKLAYNDS
jgi:hypothetical protein